MEHWRGYFVLSSAIYTSSPFVTVGSKRQHRYGSDQKGSRAVDLLHPDTYEGASETTNKPCGMSGIVAKPRVIRIGRSGDVEMNE